MNSHRKTSRPEDLRNLRVREFLLSSSFEVPLAQNATRDPGPGWTAWGGAARTSFSGQDSDLSIDGDVTTATLGVDRAWDRLMLLVPCPCKKHGRRLLRQG